MKVTITEGCTAFDTKIDGKSLCDFESHQIEKVYDEVLVKVKEGLINNTISFNSLISIFQYEEWKMDEHSCEQCGDSVSTTTWEI